LIKSLQLLIGDCISLISLFSMIRLLCTFDVHVSLVWVKQRWNKLQT